MATISLVMIVKNEEKILEKCIDSVKSIIDEFVIVDTGSTDSTKDIIKKYGKLHEVPFTNFVETKNKALKFATSDYILFMDADETIVSGLDLLKENADKGADCVHGRIVEYYNGEISNVYNRARLWKNNKSWKFVGPGVHEAITGKGTPVTDYRIVVEHNHSHRSAESYTIRNGQYINILTSHLSKNPDDSRGIFYLARTYKDNADYLEAITQYKKYLKLNTGYLDENWQAAYDIGICWNALSEYNLAIQAFELAESIDANRSENLTAIGVIYFKLSKWNLAIKYFEKALKPLPNHVILFMNPKDYYQNPLEYLVLAHNEINNYKKARDYADLLSKSYEKPDARLVNNLTILNKMAYKTIFLCLGNTPEEVYGNVMEKRGVGGVETTYLEVPFELAKRGHTCFVFCKCETEHTYKGVYFVPFGKIHEYTNLNPDVIITSRWFDVLGNFPNAKKVIWVQDIFAPDYSGLNVYENSDAIVCSSLWHQEYLAQRLQLPVSRVHVIPLSIRKELFADKHIARIPGKVIYSSSPDRGLYLLKDMWEDIVKAVPNINLTVAYGWDTQKNASKDEHWQEKTQKDIATIEEFVKKHNNITLTGRITKEQLAKEMLSSNLYLYPHNFWETFCITALETQAAGIPMITTGIGALNTTLSKKGNVLIGESPNTQEYKEKFITAISSFLTDDNKRQIYSDECISFVNSQKTWDKIAEDWENLIYTL
jgi:glycosyltransferase involved in cell wall biosynthesis